MKISLPSASAICKRVQVSVSGEQWSVDGTMHEAADMSEQT